MNDEFATNLLWFTGGFIVSLCAMYALAKIHDRPEVIFQGSVAYVLLWIGIRFALQMML